MPAKVLILVGESGSGKTTLASKLEERGWHRVSAGDAIRRLMGSLGKSASRDAMSQFGKKYLASHGHLQFAKVLFANVPLGRNIVIEGIRPPEVIQDLKRIFPSLIVVFVEVPPNTRRQRLVARDGISESAWQSLNSDPMETQLHKVRQLAQHTLENTGSIEGSTEALFKLVEHR